MKRSLSIASVAAALFLASVLVSARTQDAPANRPNPRGLGGQMGRGMPGQDPMNGMPKRRDLKVELGLTDVQQTDIRRARENAQRDRLRKSTDLKIASLDLRSLLRAEKVDEKAIAIKLAEVQAAQGALLKIRVDSALAMKRILTPEQQKKMGMGQRMKMRGLNRPGRGRRGRPMGPGMDDDADFDLDDEADHIRPGAPAIR